ncbi:MAG: iron ABC transporter permease, partial [Flavobacterium sp.]|nr:iron ABC transporter permease [Flavobacterium sp.]
MKQKSYTKQFSALSFVLILLVLINISFGSVSIPFHEILDILSGNNSSKSSWDLIIL